MATTTQPATEKQLGFIHSLLKSRDLPVAGKDHAEALLIERCFDVMGQKDIAKHEASAVIDYLKARPMVASKGTGPDLTAVPESKYALIDGDGVTRFYEVVRRKSGAVFVNLLIGHPGDWKRVYLSKARQNSVGVRIAGNPKAAAKLFADRHGVCAKCLSPLSDEESIRAGLGPICRNAF